MLFLEEQLNKTPKVRESGLQGPVVGTAAGGATGSPPSPWPLLPVGSSSPVRLWTVRGKIGFITQSSQHLRPWDVEEEIFPGFKGRVPEQLCLPHSTLTQTKPPPLPLQGEQVGSPGLIRESCLFERELNC